MPDGILASARRSLYRTAGSVVPTLRSRRSPHAKDVNPSPSIDSSRQHQHELAALPVELIQHILAFVTCDARSHTTFFASRRTLTACALVCRTWYRCALEIIYADIRLVNLQSALLLFRTLSERPEFAARVQSLHLPGAEGNAPRDPREMLSKFGDAQTRSRRSLPSPLIRVVALCHGIYSLHINLAPTDAPVPILSSLLDALKLPRLQSLWINFSQRLGFNIATWSAEGLLLVLSHPALSSLRTFSLTNVLIAYGSGVPLPRPKSLPRLRILRLHSVKAFEAVDEPIQALLEHLPVTSLESVIISGHSKVYHPTRTFGALASTLRSLWISHIGFSPLEGFANVTHLRAGLIPLEMMAASDLPPRLQSLVVELPAITLDPTLSPFPGAATTGAMRYLLHVLPAHEELREVMFHGRVRAPQIKLFRMFAILCANAGEELGLRVSTEAVATGGVYYARSGFGPDLSLM